MSTIVITPPGRLNLPAWRELWESREVLYRFGVRDIVLRYRQTAVGVAWVILQPLAAAGIFAIVFGQVANLSSGNVPYFVFSLAGMLVWNLFNGIVGRSSSSLVANQALVSKVFFPRMLVPLSSVLSVLVDFLVATALFVVLLFVYGINPGWQVLTLPLWVAVAVVFASGIGLAASAVMVKYRDVNYALPWVMQILLYATPVAYTLDSVPRDLLWLFNLNPLTWLLECFRWAALGSPAPPAWQMFGIAGVAVLVFAAGTLVFQKMERGFADVI
ncbi:ABC transporter permease [Isoptericola sp. NEAU-Y5]|uniref:Transport permease protein n=1 Tax=Isoptericola luteus TaxID=2879484 RepID=A0ABS7ZCW4_9MICO|nr:ABC transporter permease [Isoptericola sp. NEAU-Y5]MCA5892886.1 ABC transporter permease [Isoptericola sp. NEAU-Y5]